MKRGSFSHEELNVFVSLLEFAGQNKTREQRPRECLGQLPTTGKSIINLQAMGIKIYGWYEPITGDSKAKNSLENIVGYSWAKKVFIVGILVRILEKASCVFAHVNVTWISKES